jgi:Ca-activated chloride channel family protein
MKKLGRIVGMSLAAGMLAGALILQSCAAKHGQTARATEAPPPPPPAGWIPQGFNQNSLGLGTSTAPVSPAVKPSGDLLGGNRDGAPDIDGRYALVPRIDLQQALQASQQGGGGAKSPFREETSPADPAGRELHTVAPLALEQERLRQEVFARDARVLHIQATDAVATRVRAAMNVPAGGSYDELWIIQKPSDWTVAPDESTPRSGALMCSCPEATPMPLWVPAGQSQVPVPLKHTNVEASIVGYISSVNVRQEFHNPFSSKIEAVYVFPLPENAGVNEFVMTVGERKIRGIIREREEAKQIYEEAKSQGHVASLMTQERPNIFTQHVANIEPGKAIDIEITYFSTLPFADGAYEFTFPMVVGPRFNPPGSTQGVGAAPRNAYGSTGQATEVQYLHPAERSGHDIALSVDIDAGVAVERVDSKSHVIRVSRDSQDSGKVKVRLAESDNIPNKDFVLRYTVAGDTLKCALIAQADPKGNGGYFTLMLVPPKDLASLPRSPMEMVFVVDRSGSMDGRPIEQARAALERGLKLLEAGDSFQIIDFSDTASQLGDRPLEVTPANIQRGLQYAAGLDAKGGTMMVNGLRAALDFPHDPRRLRFVCFLTDGFIGNDNEILGELAKRLGDSRVFGVGVGSSVNRYLLAEMSRMGRGAVAYLGLNDSASDVMDRFFERVSRPALANVRIDWGGAGVSDVAPARIPDLFVGRPVVITGRYQAGFEGSIRVVGTAGGMERELVVAPEADTESRRGALACVWARTRIGELANQMLVTPAPEIPDMVKRLALEYGLMSAFTSFVAVDSMTKTAGDYGTTVPVPVPVAEGVKYETTVGGR